MMAVRRWRALWRVPDWRRACRAHCEAAGQRTTLSLCVRRRCSMHPRTPLVRVRLLRLLRPLLLLQRACLEERPSVEARQRSQMRQTADTCLMQRSTRGARPVSLIAVARDARRALRLALDTRDACSGAE